MPLVTGLDARGRPIFASSQGSPVAAIPPSSGGGTPADKLMQAVDTVDPGTSPVSKYDSRVDFAPFTNRNDSVIGQGKFATNQIQQQAARDAQARLEASSNAAQKAIAAAAAKSGGRGSGSATIIRSGTGGSSGGPSDAEATNLRSRLVAKVATQEGVAYKWGAESPKNGFDCSGLVQWAYGKLGIRMPRTSGPQAKMGTKAPISKLRPGDLVAHPGHIAVYAGNGMMWEAPHTGARVRLVRVRRDMYGVRLHLPGD
jgi:cell wall-associated NlpC family hydrolase